MLAVSVFTMEEAVGMLILLAGEKERIAIDKLQAAVRRANSVSAAMDALREECSDLLARCSNYEVELESSQQLCRRLEDQIFKV